MKRWPLAIVFSLLPWVAVVAEDQGQTVSQDQFDQWFDEISNWGRWGDADELGTLNLITPAVRAEAATLAKKGVTVSLSYDLNNVESPLNPHPLKQTTSILKVGPQTFVSEKLVLEYHGDRHTHIDALAHVVRNGQMYNGFPADSIKPSGAEKLGVHNMREGIFTRGVLVDMAWVRGVDFLPPGQAITAADLEAWEAKTGVKIRSGDALLVRTGRWERARQVGPSRLVDGAAGLHAETAKWLRARDVAVLGSDGGNDVLPSGVEGVLSPLHELAIVGLGMPLLDGLDLDRLSFEARRQGRWEFLFIAAPLRLPGGTGAPINPLAVF